MNSLIEFAGWIPAIIFPAATVIQLWEIFRSRSTRGVSWLTWFLFGVANVAVYIYTEKYFAPQTIIGFLGTALVDFIIASLALWKQTAIPEPTA